MPAKFVQRGYGQVEPNRLTGITFGHIEAQAPAYEDTTEAAKPVAELENGMFLCVVPDPSDTRGPLGRIAVLPKAAPATAMPMLVFSEKKLYDERMGYCDYVDRAADKVDGILYPRLVGLTPDTCVFTTNTINAEPETLAQGDKLFIGDDGYLIPGNAQTNTALHFEVVRVYTMPDGQPAVKVMAKAGV